MALHDPGHTITGNKLFSQMRPHVIVGGKPTHNSNSTSMFTTRTRKDSTLFSRDDNFPEVLRAGGRENPYGKACCEAGKTNATNEAYDNRQTHFDYPYRQKGANFFPSKSMAVNQLDQCCEFDPSYLKSGTGGTDPSSMLLLLKKSSEETKEALDAAKKAVEAAEKAGDATATKEAEELVSVLEKTIEDNNNKIAELEKEIAEAAKAAEEAKAEAEKKAKAEEEARKAEEEARKKAEEEANKK